MREAMNSTMSTAESAIAMLAEGDEMAWEPEHGQNHQRQQQQDTAPAAADTLVDDEFDPWAPLDMYDAGSMAPKPFRRATRLPRFKPAACRAARASARPDRAAGVINISSATVTLGGRPAAPAVGKLTFAEFAPALKRLQAAARTGARATAAARRAQQSAFGPRPLEVPEEGAQDPDEDTDDFGGDGGVGYDGGARMPCLGAC